jgi:hypothetical protein
MAEFTNVLVTDTFDQWRIKTNNIGADVTALIGTVETDLDGFRTEIGTTISDFEAELDTTLSSYVTLAGAQNITGAKTFQNTVDANGTLFLNYDDSGVQTFGVELGLNAPETEVQSFIDFHAGNVYDDYAARIFRKDTGEFEISQRGSGPLYLNTTDGANIEMYGNTAPSGTRSSILYDATNHYFRDKNGANSGLTVNNGGITINTGKMKLNGLDYTWPSGRSGNRYLKTDVNGALSWEAVAGGTGDVNVSTLVFNDIVPVGTIMPWAGASLPADGKWKFCDGEEVLKTAYPELTTILGGNSPKYGTAANGYIKLPDLEQKVPVGAGGAFNLGNTGGGISSSINGSTGSTALTLNQIPNVAGNFKTTRATVISASGAFSLAGNAGGSGNTTAGGDNGKSVNFNLGGGGQGHSHSLAGSVSTLQPYLVTKYIIKVLPDDVQQVSIAAGNGVNVKDALSNDSTTLDLFSTKIELLTDNAQFKFNNRRLELVTPAVSQDDITSQINTAVTGLATTGYVQTAVTGLATTSYVDTAATAAGKTIRSPATLALSGTTTTAGFIIVNAGSVTTSKSGRYGRTYTTVGSSVNITADGQTYNFKTGDTAGESQIVCIPIRAGASYSITGSTVTATFIPLS